MSTPERDRIGDANRILWWIGWHPLPVILVGLVVLGLPIWLIGVLYVNKQYKSVITDYRDLVERRRKAHAKDLKGGTTLYTLLGGDPSFILLKPASTQYTTHLLVGTSSVTAVEGLYIDISTRIPYFRQKNQEIFYDQITSVNFESGALRIRTSDGKELSYRSTQRPDDALRTLRDRIRSHKQSAS